VRLPHYLNTSLTDYVSDQDEFEGPVVAHVTIGPPRPRLATHAAATAGVTP
jgi:hypothetical protein